MAGAVRDELEGTTRHLDRALRAIEDGIHSLRQKLLARQLADTLSDEEWTPSHTSETGLSAEDLRRRATEIRSNQHE